MTQYEPNVYGDEIADVYDELYSEADPACIDLLAELAGSGPALELGIGTGRIALPLLQRGVAVEGLDASTAMVAKLRAKSRGADIPVHMGSFQHFELSRKFSIIYVVFNTFYSLQSQDQQIACLQSVSRHLAPGGRFVIEAFVPDLTRFVDNQSVRLIALSEQGARIDVAMLDPVAQHVESRHVTLSEKGIRTYPVRLRYTWPSELDLMGRIAGLRLQDRWGTWSRQPFTRESKKHVSVYGVAP